MCRAHIFPYNPNVIHEHYAGFLDNLENKSLNLQVHYNLRPTFQSPIITTHLGSAQVTSARWGLVPLGWKQEKPPNSTFNARRETIEEQLAIKRGVWAPAMKSKRCLVITGGYYEWTGPKTDPLPWYVHMPDRTVFSFAGLSSYHSEYGVSYTIITSPPSENVKNIHDRMPVVIKPEHYDAWLSSDVAVEDAVSLLDDHNNNELVFHRVSKDLVNTRKNVTKCLEPVAA